MNSILEKMFYLYKSSKLVYKIRYMNVDIDALFTSVGIETWAYCNRHCHYCPMNTVGYNYGYMEETLFKKIIDELVELNYTKPITLAHYGEPLLDKRLEQFVMYIKEKLKSCYLSINTNGDFLTWERYQSLVKAGIDLIDVTIHDEAIPARIIDIQNKCCNDKLKVTILYEKNINNRGGSVNVETQGIVQCCPMSIAITHDGGVCVCSNDVYLTIEVGNVNQNKLIDIWNSEPYKEFRREIKKANFKYPVCKKCLSIKNKD